MKRGIAFIVLLSVVFTVAFGFTCATDNTVSAQTYFQRVNYVTAVVTSPGLNVRQGPATTYPIVCVLKQWATVKIFGKLGDWYAIYEPAKGCVGAVSSKYLKVLSSSAPAPAKTTPPKTTPPKTTPAPTTPPKTTPAPATPAGISADEQTLLNLVNKARADAGVGPLAFDMALVKTARLKAQDMVANNYFSHQSPTYGSPFDMMRQFGITFKTAGENIAGNSTVKGAFDAWMNSSGHKANILNSSFNYTGIGISPSSTYGLILVQQFIGK
ncbi:MAG: CAP domain-containing protein [Bacillota bacterium]|nr:CAP domain-containing protein [Bacillota bacterium]